MGRRPDQGALGKGKSSQSFSEVNRFKEGSQFVLIVANNADFGSFAALMYSELRALLDGHGGDTAVTEEEFARYLITAVKVRSERAGAQWFLAHGNTRTNIPLDSGWALPTPVMELLAGIGEVTIGSGDVKVYPVWSKEADDLVLTLEERDVVTRNLRAAFSSVNVPFHTAIPADRDGDFTVMTMTYFPHLEEWWSNEAISRENAATNMLLGLTPVTVERLPRSAEYTVVDTEQLAAALASLPVWVPDLAMHRRVIVRYLVEMARLAS